MEDKIIDESIFKKEYTQQEVLRIIQFVTSDPDFLINREMAKADLIAFHANIESPKDKRNDVYNRLEDSNWDPSN